MSSIYRFRDEKLWVSSGVAETINDECARRLPHSPAGARVALEAHLRLHAHHGGSDRGFDIEDSPLDDPEVRTLFAHAVSAFAVDVFAAVRKEPHPVDLDWLVALDPFYQTGWLHWLETLHAMLRRSLDGTIEALVLPAEPGLRSGIEAHQYEEFDRQPPYSREEIARRRTYVQRILAAPEYFGERIVDRAIEALYEREIWIGDLEQAAATYELVGRDTTNLRKRAGFLREIWSTPHENGPREVFADWLIEQNDIRGEFIIEQLRGSTARHPSQHTWLGSLGFVIVEHAYERGFVAWCRIDSSVLTAAPGLWTHPAWATVDRFELTGEAPAAFLEHMRR